MTEEGVLILILISERHKSECCHVRIKRIVKGSLSEEFFVPERVPRNTYSPISPSERSESIV